MDTDVVVVEGGSAGLQAALTLGRMRFDVTVVDAGQPSNAPAHAIVPSSWSFLGPRRGRRGHAGR